MESDVIQAFRLGASDFVAWPIREAEVVSAVERVLRQGRARREREQLARQLNQTNQELQRRVRELTTIFAIGKAVVSTTDQLALFDKILEGAAYVAEADSGWLLSRDEQTKKYILRACRNLPADIYSRINQPYDDGISSLVALSGEALSIHGEPMKRFKVSRLGQAVLVIPIKVKNEVVGLLVSTRKAARAFTPSQQALLEAVADYASISLVNARLFKALEERLDSLQHSADASQIDRRIQEELLEATNAELNRCLGSMKNDLNLLTGNEPDKLSGEQLRAMLAIQDNLGNALEIIDSIQHLYPMEAGKPRQPVDLKELAHQAIRKFLPIAKQSRSQIQSEMPANPVHIQAEARLISRVLEGLISNALRYTPPGTRVILTLETNSKEAQLSVQDNGGGFDPKLMTRLFEARSKNLTGSPVRYGGIGISLPLVKEILEAHGGKAWAESKPGDGCAFHITLPLSSQ
jgi:signal transduction histidine kinase